MLSFYLQVLENNNDRDYYTEIYQRYWKLLLYIAREKLRRDDLAEDCVQMTFLDVATHFENVKAVSEEKVKSYLITIVKRKAILLNKEMNKSKEASLEEWLENNGEGIYSDEEFWQDISYLEVADVIHKLPENLRDTCLLKYVHNFDNYSIAKALDITETNVRVRLNRAKGMLKTILEQGGE